MKEYKKEYKTIEEMQDAVYGQTVKDVLITIVDRLDKMRHGSVLMSGTVEDGCAYSICEIAEKIFASQVDLNANEYDTKQLWEKCIEKAIIIYFNYELVTKQVHDFFEKDKQNI